MEDIEAKKKSLLWQCRRGIKEIEIILLPFLEEHYQNESKEIRDGFERLLACEDLDIFEWFTDREKSSDANMEMIVDVVLSRVGAKP